MGTCYTVEVKGSVFVVGTVDLLFEADGPFGAKLTAPQTLTVAQAVPLSLAWGDCKGCPETGRWAIDLNLPKLDVKFSKDLGIDVGKAINLPGFGRLRSVKVDGQLQDIKVGIVVKVHQCPDPPVLQPGNAPPALPGGGAPGTPDKPPAGEQPGDAPKPGAGGGSPEPAKPGGGQKR